ncbi:formyl transferase [Chlorobium sp. BLA1]|uniref:formyltransferase family protein n=1 Tax=Candidatus Chlorobium masyuteum TaxID=2716876 RepID=UPI001422055E|nr:formyltransferase family protein [Candidatus Chlorobium masyuteum]NHQ59215.1 formyl transferase [Candidatus Chlorobium masyuteum]
MRIVFIGTVEFSRQALEKLFSIGAEIVGVCTLSESGFNSDHVDLAPLCKKKGIPCYNALDINSLEVLNWISSKTPDILFCFGWSRLLKTALLQLAPLGVIGFHPAALPKNRGRHPLIWALVLGLDKTASTFFFMDEGADTGDILSQREVCIDPFDDAASLYAKVTKTALVQIEEFLPQLSAGSFVRSKQTGGQANTWRKRSYADGRIDWRMTALSIYNLVRGLTRPYPGAHLVVDGQEIKVWKTAVVKDDGQNIEPGKIIAYSGVSPVVKCGQDAICLLSTEPSFQPIVGSYL